MRSRLARTLTAAAVSFSLLGGSVQAQQLPAPSPYAQAFEIAVGDVLGKAPIEPNARSDLLIDPLIDGDTGAQSTATRQIEVQIRDFIAARFSDKYVVKPFTPENIAGLPLLLIGTFTPIYATARTTGPHDAFRLCFALLDLKTRRIISTGFARSTTTGINPVVTPSFNEAPAKAKDEAVDGYVSTCQGPKAGDPIHPSYASRLDAAAIISQAIMAYDDGKYEEANALFLRARQLPGGNQLRVLNGLYLTYLKLNRQREAQAVMSELVALGHVKPRPGPQQPERTASPAPAGTGPTPAPNGISVPASAVSVPTSGSAAPVPLGVGPVPQCRSFGHRAG